MPAWRWPIAQSPKGLLTAKPKFMTISSVSQAMTLNTSCYSWHESFTKSGPRPKCVAFGHCIGFAPKSLASAVPRVVASTAERPTDPAVAMSCVTVSHRSWQKQREGERHVPLCVMCVHNFAPGKVGRLPLLLQST